MRVIVFLFIFALFSTNLFCFDLTDFQTVKSKIKNSAAEINILSVKVSSTYIETNNQAKIDTIVSANIFDFKRLTNSEQNDFFVRISDLMNSSDTHYSIRSKKWIASINIRNKSIYYISKDNAIIPNEYVSFLNDLNIDKLFDLSSKFHSLNQVNVKSDTSIVTDCNFNASDCYKLIFKFTYSGILRTNTQYIDVICQYVFDRKSNLLLENSITMSKYDDIPQNALVYNRSVSKYDYKNINKEFPPEYFDYKHLLGLGYTLNVEK